MAAVLDAIEKLPAHIVGHFYAAAKFGHWPATSIVEGYEDRFDRGVPRPQRRRRDQHALPVPLLRRRERPRRATSPPTCGSCARRRRRASVSRSAPTRTAPRTRAVASTRCSRCSTRSGSTNWSSRSADGSRGSRCARPSPRRSSGPEPVAAGADRRGGTSATARAPAAAARKTAPSQPRQAETGRARAEGRSLVAVPRPHRRQRTEGRRLPSACAREGGLASARGGSAARRVVAKRNRSPSPRRNRSPRSPPPKPAPQSRRAKPAHEALPAKRRQGHRPDARQDRGSPRRDTRRRKEPAGRPDRQTGAPRPPARACNGPAPPSRKPKPRRKHPRRRPSPRRASAPRSSRPHASPSPRNRRSREPRRNRAADRCSPCGFAKRNTTKENHMSEIARIRNVAVVGPAPLGQDDAGRGRCSPTAARSRGGVRSPTAPRRPISSPSASTAHSRRAPGSRTRRRPTSTSRSSTAPGSSTSTRRRSSR